MNLYREPDITAEIRKGRLTWLGHMERKEKKNCEEGVQENRRRKTSVGKPRKRRLEDAENDLKKLEKNI
jgi:hypothetical protein